MTKYNILSIYGSHDSSVCFFDKNNKLRVFEYERFAKKRYAMFSSRFDSRQDLGTSQKIRRDFLSLVLNNINGPITRIVFGELCHEDKTLLLEFFPGADFFEVDHHKAHAAAGFFLSEFKDATVFSIDGVGKNGIKVYRGFSDELHDQEVIDLDLGNPYSGVAYLISEISPGPEGPSATNSLAYAGKIMGLCAYGKVRTEWMNPFRTYYRNNNLVELCGKINIPYGYNTTSSQDSYDLAATSQFIFEEMMDSVILSRSGDNIVLSGGCALNVLYNQKLFRSGKNVFIPPNPNDCGIAYGMFSLLFPKDCFEPEYSGIPILDSLTNRVRTPLDVNKIVDLILDGKILGVIIDNSEVGPRALGNRSIICHASFPGMKDILNKKVKFREWYRPFAPVCREEDVLEFFDSNPPSKYMGFAPRVICENIPAVTHEDGTARLQTVGLHDHKLFRSILSELKLRNKIPVILNTSFNIKGRPILTSYEDAFFVLENTDLDGIVTEFGIFLKNE